MWRKLVLMTILSVLLVGMPLFGANENQSVKESNQTKERVDQTHRPTLQNVNHLSIPQPEKQVPAEGEITIEGYSLEELENLPTGALKKIYERTDAPEISRIIDSRWTQTANYEKSVLTLDAESEPNDDYTTANAITDSMGAAIDPGGDADYFSFSASANTEYTFTTHDLPGSASNAGDTKMYLYDTDGTTELAYNDDIGWPIYYSEISHVIETAGTYYVKITGYSSSTTGDYLLTMTSAAAPAADAYEPNNTLADATPITDGQTITDLNIYPEGDTDIFTFTGMANYTASINCAATDFDGEIVLLASDSTVVDSYDAYGDGDSTGFELPSDGTYYILYKYWSDFSTATGDYSITLNLIAPVGASPYNGTIVVNEIMQNPDAVSDTYGEFVELQNTGDTDVDIEGWTLMDLDYDSFVIHGDTTGYGYEGGGGTTVIPAGGFLVLGRSTVTTENGGMTVDYEYSGSYGEADYFSLSNSGDEVSLLDAGSLGVDTVEYDGGPDFPDPTGKSMELIDPTFDNNVGMNWQEAWTTYGDGDYGTPGAVNSTEPDYIPDAYEPNNTSDSSAYITPGTHDLTLSDADDEYDWFWYAVDANDTVTVTISFDDTALDYDLYLYNMQGDMVSSSAGVSSPEQVEYIFTGPDTAFIAVSAWSGAGDYTLQFDYGMAPKAAPFVDGFEDGAYDGWTILDMDGNGYTWDISTYGGNAYEGDYYMDLGYNSSGNNDWLISPPLDVTSNEQVRFWMTNNSSYYTEVVKVRLSTTASTDTADFDVTLDELGINQNYEWMELVYDLSAYAGSTVRVAIQNVSLDQYYTYFDYFQFTHPAAAGAIEGIVTNSETGNPVEGVTVAAEDSVTLTDASGYYLLENISSGLQPVAFLMDGYQEAFFNVNVVTDDTISLAPALQPLGFSTVYENSYEAGQDTGWTYTGGPNAWHRNAGFTYETTDVTPADGDSFLVVGGADGYDLNESAWWMNLTNSEMDLTAFNNATVYFKLYLDSESGWDEFQVLANQPAIDGGTYYTLDVNGDGVADDNDLLSGETGGWIEVEADLSPFTGPTWGDGVEIAFLFQSDGSVISGFGAAVDSVVIVGGTGMPILPPENLTADSYIDNEVPLMWDAPAAGASAFRTMQLNMGNDEHVELGKGRVSNHGVAEEYVREWNIGNGRVTQPEVLQSYNVFRVNLDEDPMAENPTLVANVVDNVYTDTDVENFTNYGYAVTAVYDEGESGFSNTVSAVPGEPVAAALPYSQDFESATIPDLPADWGQQIFGENGWATGDSSSASSSYFEFPEHGQFAYVNDDGVGSGVNSTSILWSPWMDASSQTDVRMNFNTYSYGFSERHYVVMRIGLTEEFTIIDSIENTDGWEYRFYNISDQVAGEANFQVGFLMADPGTWGYGWAVDDFSVEPLETGTVTGTVTSTLDGSPIENAMIEAPAFGVSTMTGTDGTYSFDVPSGATDFIFSAWQYHSAVAEDVAITANTENVVDMALDLYLPEPMNLMLMENPDASATLNWLAPLPPGEVAYDDGSVESWYWVANPASESHYFAQHFTAPVSAPFTLNSVGIFGLADVPTAFNAVYLVPDVGGAPDMANPIATMTDVAMTGTWDMGPEWAMVDFNAEVTGSSDFWVLVQWQEGVSTGPFIGTDTDGIIAGRSFWSDDAGMTWNGVAANFMIRGYLNIGGTVVAASTGEPVTSANGQALSQIENLRASNNTAQSVEAPSLGLESITSPNDFLHFNVYRATESMGYGETPLVSGLSETSYTDDTGEFGTEYYYIVTAEYDEGESAPTNEVSYTPVEEPWLTLSTDSLGVTMEFMQQSAGTDFLIGNPGLDTLEYEMTYNAAAGRFASAREIDGAHIWTGTPFPSPAAGTTLDLVLRLTNASSDAEWIDSTAVQFPVGMTVNSATNFVGLDNGNFLEATINGSDGALVSWDDTDGGYGEIYSTETAVCTLNVTFASDWEGNAELDYFISGDIFGSEPHEVSGTFIWAPPVFTVSFDPDSGSVLPQTDPGTEVLVNVATGEYTPGFYPGFISLMTNDPDFPVVDIPFDINMKPQMGYMTGQVLNAYDGSPIEGVEIWMNGDMMMTTDADGAFGHDMLVGMYDVSFNHPDFYPVDYTDMEVPADDTLRMDVEMEANVMGISDLSATDAEGGIQLDWALGTPPASEFSDDFEGYDDFATAFDPWMLIDNDGSTTYGIVDIDFPGSNSPMAYLIFNPSQTTPSMGDTLAHSGDKFAACFASTSPPNDDYLITPPIEVAAGYEFSFFAKSYTDAYGLERFKVGVSTTGTSPGDFSTISAGDYVEAPTTWTEYSYDLSDYAGQTVYLSIQCVSNDAFIFFVDDVYVGPAGTSNALVDNQNQSNPGLEIAGKIPGMAGNDVSGIQGPTSKSLTGARYEREAPATDFEPNPRVMSTMAMLESFEIYRGESAGDLSMHMTVDAENESVLDTTDLTVNTMYYYAVRAVYDIGVSAMSDTVEATYTAVGVEEDALPKVFALEQNYPNPFNPTTTIKYQLPKATDVKIVVFNMLGQRIHTLVNETQEPGFYDLQWDGRNDMGVKVASGVYFYHIKAGDFTKTRKMLFLK